MSSLSIPRSPVTRVSSLAEPSRPHKRRKLEEGESDSLVPPHSSLMRLTDASAPVDILHESLLESCALPDLTFDCTASRLALHLLVDVSDGPSKDLQACVEGVRLHNEQSELFAERARAAARAVSASSSTTLPHTNAAVDRVEKELSRSPPPARKAPPSAPRSDREALTRSESKKRRSRSPSPRRAKVRDDDQSRRESGKDEASQISVFEAMARDIRLLRLRQPLRCNQLKVAIDEKTGRTSCFITKTDSKDWPDFLYKAVLAGYIERCNFEKATGWRYWLAARYARSEPPEQREEVSAYKELGEVIQRLRLARPVSCWDLKAALDAQREGLSQRLVRRANQTTWNELLNRASQEGYVLKTGAQGSKLYAATTPAHESQKILDLDHFYDLLVFRNWAYRRTITEIELVTYLSRRVFNAPERTWERVGAFSWFSYLKAAVKAGALEVVWEQASAVPEVDFSLSEYGLRWRERAGCDNSGSR